MLTHSILQRIVSVVKNILQVERIALLAYIDKNGECFSIFQDCYFEDNNPAELNLLVVGEFEMNKRSATVDVIEQKCKQFIPITVLLLTPEKFEKMIRSGHSLAIQVIRSNQIIFERPKLLRKIPLFDDYMDKSENGCDPQLWFERSSNFFQIAITQHSLRNYGMALFCLHQAAEQSLIFLIRLIVGIKLGTHNLDRLLKVVKFHNRCAAEVFAIQSRQEKLCFQLLKKAYIDYRYKSELICTEQDVNYLMSEISKLNEIAENVRSKQFKEISIRV